MTTYFAFVHKDPDSAYGIVFPDVPGCYSAGDTYEQAVANAEEALRLHFEVARDLGWTLPEPRSFEDLLADPEIKEEATQAPLIAVPLSPVNDAETEIRVSLAPDLVDAIDVAARARGQTRSAFLADAARARLSE